MAFWIRRSASVVLGLAAAALGLGSATAGALRRHAWYEDATRATNDNWFIGLFSPKRSSP